MAQHNQTEEKVHIDTLNSEQGRQDVVNIAKFKQPEQSRSPEISAFEQVMSQMNIADRGAFNSQYSQMWKETSDDNELLSVFMCEIDLFKAYHDNYGQQGASFMLLVVGLALKNTCEKYGCFLAHYQKEEFGILMKGGDPQKALEVAESLRQAVEETRTEHTFSSVSRVVTLSIGVSSIYPNSMQVLMRQVDGALNKAKVSGRNQVSYDSLQVKETAIVDETLQIEKTIEPEQEQVIDELEESHFSQFLMDMEIADRKAFNHNSVKLWQECKSENELLSMIVCEVDFLQPYIDHCGKLASEDILLITACALQQTCEKFGGFIYYMGKDKYIVLLKGGNATNALRVAEYLHTFIAESQTEHKYSEIGDVMTVSVGLSSIFPSDINSMRVLMGETNKALNIAIKSGRNQTSLG
jgi:diguanylate cyclase (GGDEF)-like protein